MKTKSLKLLLSAGGVLAITSLALGYSFIENSFGFPLKWITGTIPMQIMVDNTTHLIDGNTRATSIKSAMQTWNTKLGTVQFSPQIVAVGSGLDHDHINQIFFSSTAYNYGWDINTLAVTTDWYAGDQRKEADIIFNTAFSWDSYSGALHHVNNVYVYDVQRVALHELGHVLGLDHPDENGQSVSAIMNSIISDIDSLQPDDIAGAQNLYGAPGVIPGNDNFANALTITLNNNSAQTTGTNVAATKEVGEPNHGGDPGGHSVWWKWTASVNGTVSVDTFGSNYDTTLGIYTGASVASLTTVASNDGAIHTSAVTFSATNGTTYYIAVDGWGGYSGTIDLNLNLTYPPSITSQPASQTVVEGQSASFTVAASGTPPLTYQWRKNAVNIGGATTNSLTINPAAVGDAGNFDVVVSNGGGQVTSAVAMLTVVPLFSVITAQPISQTVTEGQNVSFAVATNGGNLVLNYQWREDGINLAGANASTLNLNNVLYTQSGNYDVVISAGGGSVASAVAVLTVIPTAPVVTSLSPNRQLLIPGQDLNLSVTATGLGTLSYQWIHNGRPINGATASSYSLSSLSVRDGGYFFVDVTDSEGTRHSAPTFVTVMPTGTQLVGWGDDSYGQTNIPPGLTNPIAIAAGDLHSLALQADGTVVAWGYNQDGVTNVPAGATNVVNVSASGKQSFALRADGTVVAWGDNRSGQTTVPIGLSGVVAIDAGDNFSMALKTDGTVVAWGDNSYGQTTVPAGLANVVAISAGSSFALALKSDGTVVVWGDRSAGYNVIVETDGPTVLNEVIILDAGDNFSLALKSDGKVVAWGDNSYGQTTVPPGLANVTAISAGGATSLALKRDGTVVGWGFNYFGQGTVPVGLNNVGAVCLGGRHSLALVTPPPFSITAQPLGKGVAAGQSELLSVTISGLGPFTYQWQKNGVNIPGASGATFSLTNLQVSDAGIYSVIVTNAAGSVMSSGASVVVTHVAADFNGDNGSDLVWSNTANGDRYIWLMNGGSVSSSVYLGNIAPQWSVATGDFNGDGQADLLWSNTITGDRYIWLMNGTSVTSSVCLGNVAPQWTVVTGDFNGDGQSDLLWSNLTTGDRYIWIMNGTAVGSSVYVGHLSSSWLIAGTGDFNGDGQSDIVWQNMVTGECSIWLMNGTHMSSNVSLGLVSLTMRIATVGDYNGDGQPDLVWQNIVTGERLIWLMNGTDVSTSVSMGVVGSQWTIGPNVLPAPSGHVSADFNADGQSDLLWSNTSTGDRYFWLMNGTSVSSSVFLGTIAPKWTVATGDFNADGQSDLLWSNTDTGDRYFWLMSGTSVSSSVFLGTVAPQWTAVTGDFNADGQADLLWSNNSTGDRYFWLMNGTSVSSSVFLGNVASQWTVVTGDFNADGQTDLLWSNTATGDRYVWLLSGTAVSSSVYLGNVASQWTVTTGDFNADGQTDLLWSNTSTGDRYVWLMNGTSVGSSVFLGNVGIQWAIGD